MDVTRVLNSNPGSYPSIAVNATAGDGKAVTLFLWGFMPHVRSTITSRYVAAGGRNEMSTAPRATEGSEDFCFRPGKVGRNCFFFPPCA